MKTNGVIFLLTIGTMVTQAQIYNIQEMTTVEIEALDREKTIVIIPGGILEEHGPYLPSFCDGYQNQALTTEIANEIAKRSGWKVLIFPTIPLGTGGANEIGRKYSFSGTYAVRHNVLASIFMDLATEIGEQGFKNIFIVHMHGAPNHNQALDQACEYFSETYNGRMVNIHNLAFSFDWGFNNDIEKKEDGFTVHAGLTEHSVLYYLKPDLKKNGHQNASPVTAANPDDLVTLATKKDWLGYFGSPRLATSSIGEKYWKAFTQHILNQVDEILDNKYDFTKPTYYQSISNNPVFKQINEDAKKIDKQREQKQIEWLKKKGLN